MSHEHLPLEEWVRLYCPELNENQVKLLLERVKGETKITISPPTPTNYTANVEKEKA